MKILENLKSKIVSWLGKKETVVNPNVTKEQDLQQENTELKAEIKKLNSRISFMTEKVEKMTTQQDQMMCQMEQILYYTSGSADADSMVPETKIENGKNIVQIKGNFRLN